MFADLIGNQAEKVTHVGLVRLNLKNLAAYRLRLLQTPGVMVLQGEVQGFNHSIHAC